MARAFYFDREIIILDEATSALDPETEAQILKTIGAMKGIKTLIVITHGRQILKACDQVYELSQGQLKPLMNYDGIEAEQKQDVYARARV